MKQLSLMILSLLIVFVFVGCGIKTDTHNSILPTEKVVKVSDDTFDDQISTAYIRVDSQISGADEAVGRIMMLKRFWEDQFPNKRIVTMSIVTGNGGGYGYPIVIGLLIHYELR